MAKRKNEDGWPPFSFFRELYTMFALFFFSGAVVFLGCLICYTLCSSHFSGSAIGPVHRQSTLTRNDTAFLAG